MAQAEGMSHAVDVISIVSRLSLSAALQLCAKELWLLFRLDDSPSDVQVEVLQCMAPLAMRYQRKRTINRETHNPVIEKCDPLKWPR